MAVLTESAFLDTLVIFSSLFATLYIWMKWKHTYWQRRGVPTLPAHWFFGHFKDACLQRKPAGKVLGDLYQQAKDKDVLGIYILHKPFLILKNPELIKQIMIRDFNVFPNHHFRGATTSDTVGKWTLFTIHNPEWKYLRMKMSPVFTSGKLKSLFLLMQESGEKMRDHLHDLAEDKFKTVPITVKDIFYKYTTDVISSVAFGIRLNCFDTPSPEFYENSRKAVLATFLRTVQFFFLFFLPNIGQHLGGSILGKYTNYFRKVFWDSMDNRSITKTKRGDLIDSLLQIKNEKPDNSNIKYEGDVLFAQAAIFFVAGRETSITTMTCALFELAKQPEMQKHLREEILKAIEDANGVTYEAVQNMKYLHQVINETLRLHPPAPIIDRVPVSNYTFPGTKITIEKDTPVYVVLHGLQSDPTHWKDPTRFDPERFSDEKKNEIASCTFMPFGEGPRNCIGMRLGTLQTAVGLIAVLRDYEVSLNPSWKTPIDPRNVFTSPPPKFLLNFKKIFARRIWSSRHAAFIKGVLQKILCGLRKMAMITEYVFLDTLLIFLSLFATLYLWMKWKHTYWQRRGISTLPAAHWFFGHFKDAILMRKSAAVVFGEMYQQATDKDAVGIYILHKPFLILKNPELIKQIMIRDFNVFPNHHFRARNNSDKVGKWTLFTVLNPEWKHLRMKMSPVFTSGKLKNLFLLMQESGENMRNHLHDLIGDKSKTVPIPIKDIFYKYTTDVISSMAFGIQINCFDTPPSEFYKNSCKAVQMTLSRSLQTFFLFFLPNIGKHLGGALLGNYTDYFRKVFWNSMDNRSITKTKRGDLIDSLLQLKNEKPDNTNIKYEGDVLFAQAAIFFVAGRETTIATMTCALFELAKQPEMQKRLREEILKEIQDANGVMYEAIQNMKYLHQVINETLRIYPPTPVLDRTPIRDYTFPGMKITVEKETPVYVALHGIHSDPTYWKDPMRFDPERFSDERKNEIVSCTFLPFGEGPRNCIGMRLGTLQTAMGLLTILRDYEVALNPSWKNPVDHRSVFNQPPTGFLFNFKKI
ncbi:uncharacterized protein LOC105199238 [Solenopsis invicta]|uniref:uncharacterized protein LOC105199238 n=1 Tax=Solenopsis invicta TaxID=13686 RepID=UPI00193E2ADA|nr:uncharacterized protein LOC105199238 [Solenopsis invicta]